MKQYGFEYSRYDLTKLDIALTYDDVLDPVNYSEVRHRSDVDLSTRLTKNLKLNMPIVSANMSSVTESAMAIAMARQGGIGIIHRYRSIEETIKEVNRVKRWRTHIIDSAYSIQRDASIESARDLMERYNVSGLLVTEGKTLKGILTSRDMKAAEILESKLVSEVMTPLDHKLITAKVGISLEEAKRILYTNRIEKLPLLYENGDLYGLITSKDIRKIEEFPDAALDSKGRLLVGAAIGTDGDYMERAEELVKAGIDLLVLDVAHGDSKHAIEVTAGLKAKFGDRTEIMGGNVAKGEAVERYIGAGADSVKVGVGGGAVCTTRLVTGAGMPQLTAVAICAEAAEKYNIPIVADGGIRMSGDICKALIAGAHTVMLGNLLAGTDESPGKVITRKGKRVKKYMGMASEEANLRRTDKKRTDEDLTSYAEEGVSTYVPYKGPVEPLIEKLLGGIRSGASYANAKCIEDFRKGEVYLTRITSAGMKESTPHVESED